jgi:transcriptional regulator with XRE-family HTH domain
MAMALRKPCASRSSWRGFGLPRLGAYVVAVSPQLAGSSTQPILGERLRVLRRARGASLAAVADATGISVSFLSLLESGKTDVTISRLLRLGSYYNVPITDLLPTGDADRVIVRAAEVQRGHPHRGVEVATIRAQGESSLSAHVWTIEPGGELTNLRDSPEDVVVHVLEGAIELIWPDEKSTVTLDVGDTMFFRVEGTHTCRNATSELARAMLVSSGIR